jgi:hypothetical protein
MEVAHGAHRSGDVGLNSASLPFLSSSKIYPKRHLDGKNYFYVEYVQAEGELGNRFIIAVICVLYNHHLFTKLGF